MSAERKIIVTIKETILGDNVDCNIRVEFMGVFPGGNPELVKYLSWAIEDLNNVIAASQTTSMN